MTENPDTAAYLEELAQTLASHGSNLAALRMAELEQKVSPYLAAPGVPSAQAGGGGSLAGVNTAYAPTVAMGAAGLFITDGAITVTNPGSTVIIDGTSNMFKIAASGTLTLAWPAGLTSVSTNVSLTGMAPGGVLPTVIGTITDDTSVGTRASILTSAAWVVQTYFGASGNNLLVYLQIHAITWTAGVSVNAGLRYYVLKEVGI